MTKCSTHFYTVNSLGSQLQHDLVSTDILNIETKYNDVQGMFDKAPLEDVKQSVVDNLLNYAMNG